MLLFYSVVGRCCLAPLWQAAGWSKCLEVIPGLSGRMSPDDSEAISAGLRTDRGASGWRAVRPGKSAMD